MPQSIFLVDNDTDTLNKYVKTLSSQTDFEIQVATTAADALSKTMSEIPDLILMAIRLGDNETGGIDCVREMRGIGFKGTVCMMSDDHPTEKLAHAAMVGADEYLYLVKDNHENLLWEVELLLDRTRRRICHGPISFHAIQDSAYLRSRRLEPAQIDTLAKFYSHGFPSEKELAYTIGVDPRTLSKRLSRIKRKLGCTNMYQIAHLMTVLSIFSARHRKLY